VTENKGGREGMNLPNKLTVSRILLTFVFMYFLLSSGFINKILALITFLLASFTDILDGLIAKKRNLITAFGTLMDPIADKILILAAFLSFVEMRLVPAWMAVIIILRELLVTGLRITALGKRRVLSADIGGKHKMVSQTVAVFCILLFLVCREADAGTFAFWSDSFEAGYELIIRALMYITVLFTVISGASYLFRNRGLYRNVKDN